LRHEPAIASKNPMTVIYGRSSKSQNVVNSGSARKKSSLPKKPFQDLKQSKGSNE